MMLLSHHSLPIRLPSYRELCECLWLTVDPEIKGWSRSNGRGAYPTDLERALRGMQSPRGDRIRFSKIEDENAERALDRIGRALRSGPVMSAMKGRGFGAGNGHWIVITGRDGDNLRYLDPWIRRRGEKSLSRAGFLKHWDGYCLFLRHPCPCDS